MHVIVNTDGLRVEVQVRTALQQKWAELSEKMSDVVDPSIKYGGNDQFQPFLRMRSSLISRIEDLEKDLAREPESMASLNDRAKLQSIKAALTEKLAVTIGEIEALGREERNE